MIVFKWITDTPNALLLITNDKRVFFVNEDCMINETIKEHHNNRECFRIPKTTIRIGKRTILKYLDECNIFII
jgi:hypothetical protein